MPIQPIGGVGVQVRVTGLDHHCHTKYFAYAKNGGQERAYQLAQEEELRLIALHGQSVHLGYRVEPLPHKRTGERVGVTIYSSRDKRKIGHPEYLRFGVSWVDENGAKRVTSFQVGRVETVTNAEIEYARFVANTFRDVWEQCVLDGESFDPRWFAEWRSPDWEPPVPGVKPLTSKTLSSVVFATQAEVEEAKRQEAEARHDELVALLSTEKAAEEPKRRSPRPS